MLAYTEFGEGAPLVILHGLFGSGRNWTSVAKRLATSHHVFTLDLRNHGVSPWLEGMSYGEMAQDVCDFIEARGLGSVALFGHSMGGKVAMIAALGFLGLVDRLVVVDIAPVVNPPSLLAYVKAMKAVDLSAVTRRSEVEPLLMQAIPDVAERQFVLQNLIAENGRFAWRLNLDAIERGFSDILDFPTPIGSAYGGPALFVAGGRSAYVPPAAEPAILRLFPQARIVRIPDAGHWPHAEKPDAFLAAVTPFLT